MVQFQGMIAEYERAQILERSRRGKRHRARQGQVNVLSGAPYGYRYVRKSDDAAARYEINHAEADIAVPQLRGPASASTSAVSRLATAPPCNPAKGPAASAVGFQRLGAFKGSKMATGGYPSDEEYCALNQSG